MLAYSNDISMIYLKVVGHIITEADSTNSSLLERQTWVEQTFSGDD